MAVSDNRFEALGRGWQFRFGFGALCRLEQEYDRPFARVLQDAMPAISIEDMADPAKLAAAALDMRMSDIRSILRAGIVERPTEDEVDQIMDELGLAPVLEMISAAFATDVAAPKGGRAGGAGKKPRVARKG